MLRASAFAFNQTLITVLHLIISQSRLDDVAQRLQLPPDGLGRLATVLHLKIGSGRWESTYLCEDRSRIAWLGQVTIVPTGFSLKKSAVAYSINNRTGVIPFRSDSADSGLTQLSMQTMDFAQRNEYGSSQSKVEYIENCKRDKFKL